MTITIVLYIILVSTLAYFLFTLLRHITKNLSEIFNPKAFVKFVVAFFTSLVTVFFDALGIGNFATTTAIWTATNYLDDPRLLPGTLNAGFALASFVETTLFLSFIEVDPVLLFSLLISCILGAFFGTKIVVKLPTKLVQLAMGFALGFTGLLMTAKHLGFFDAISGSNIATSLNIPELIIACLGFAIFGGLESVGVGLYAPAMAICYILGLKTLVVFPIMTACCSSIMAISGAEFIKAKDFFAPAVLAMCASSLIAPFVAVRFMKVIDISILSIVVTGVVLITAVVYVIKGFSGDKKTKNATT